MGLTSSQGRLLMLTSRLNDIEAGEMTASQRQRILATQRENAAEEYNKQMSKMKLVITINGEKKDLSYSDMTSMGYLVTDSKEQIYLTKENGEWVVPTAYNLVGDKQNMFDSGVETDENGNSTISMKGKKYKVVDGTEYLKNKENLQFNLMNKTLYVMNTSDKYNGDIEINSLESDVNVEWVHDSAGDAAAESKYDYETARIGAQDNMLDLEIKQLETDHNAVIKEIESVDKLIGNNIERTFKLFSNG